MGTQNRVGDLFCWDLILPATHPIGDLGDVAATLYHVLSRDGKGHM
jgi:hypothetical protein